MTPEVRALVAGFKMIEEAMYGKKAECLNCHRISSESDCNNLQCPFCGGNMKEADNALV